MSQEHILTISVVLLAIVTFSFAAIVIPPWMGNDEPMHYEYIEVVRQGFIPPPTLFKHNRWWKDIPETLYADIEQQIVSSMKIFRFWTINELRSPDSVKDFSAIYRGATAMTQAPLYYCLCATILKIREPENVLEGLYIARFVSVLLWTLTVYLVLLLSREYFGKESPFQYLPPLLIVFMPMSFLMGGVVNNDALAVTLYSAVILLLYRHLQTPWTAGSIISVILLVLLAFMSKRTTLTILPVGLVYFLLRSVPRKNLRRILQIVACFIPLIMIVFLWALSPYSETLNLRNPVARAFREPFADTITNWSNHQVFFQYFFKSFWGSFVWGHHFFHHFEYLFIWLLLCVPGGTLFWQWLTNPSDEDVTGPVRVRVELFFMTLIITQFLLIFGRFFWQVPFWNLAQGRFMFVVLGPLYILLIEGLQTVIPDRIKAYVPGLFIFCLLIYHLSIHIRFFFPYYYMNFY